MFEVRRIFAMSHLPYSYDLAGDFVIPFVLGKDDLSGDNIAHKVAFSEGRGHYWLWRNGKFSADEFVAVAQYRRLFWFPQLVRGTPFQKYAVQMNLDLGRQMLHMYRPEYIDYVHAVEAADKAPLQEWLSGVDLVVGRPIQYPRPIGVIYGEHHRASDWEVFASVCRRRGLDDGRHHWLTGHLMFIMKPDLFAEYMTLWWDVMSEVDRVVAHEDDPYQHRKIGYLTERFLSAWLVKIRTERPELRIQTLPIVEGLFQFDRVAPGVM